MGLFGKMASRWPLSLGADPACGRSGHSLVSMSITGHNILPHNHLYLSLPPKMPPGRRPALPSRRPGSAAKMGLFANSETRRTQPGRRLFRGRAGWLPCHAGSAANGPDLSRNHRKRAFRSAGQVAPFDRSTVRQAHGKQAHGKQAHGKQAQDFAGQAAGSSTSEKNFALL